MLSHKLHFSFGSSIPWFLSLGFQGWPGKGWGDRSHGPSGVKSSKAPMALDMKPSASPRHRTTTP